MKLLLIATALHLALGASIVDVTCPDSCICQVKDEHLETSCHSYEFIKKLIPKQVSTIVRLNINNALLVNIDSKLKYLKNLHALDLSNNVITTVPSHFPYLPKLKNLNLSVNHLNNVEFSQLPKNLEHIDLSHNSISNFPKDWTNLKQLKTIDFHDNPIDCDCENLAIYEQLVKAGILRSGNLTCEYPKKFHGRDLSSVDCSLTKDNLLNSMLGDEAGSGLEEVESLDENHPMLVDDQEEFLPAKDIIHVTEENEEGSGEGSGFAPIIIPSPKACYFNCSTPKPVGIEDEKNASPAPSFKEGSAILFEDILMPNLDPTTPSPTTERQLTKEEESDIIVKETDKHLVEMVPTNDTVVGEMERASIESSNTHSVYIIVGLVIAFGAFLFIYYITKKKNQRKRNIRRNKSNENGYGEEMKPLGKGKLIEAKSQPVENSKLPAETAPLLNGNGKVAENHNVDDNSEMEEVDLRKSDRDTLTPQPERVTIKAAELPDSIPKTPLLVHRQLNSEGEVVTTPVNSD